MRIEVLGCAGSIGKGNPTTAFLVDDDLLIDMGSGVGELTLEQMCRIDQVFLSHSHLDHVLSLPLMADSVMQRRQAAGRPPILVRALAQTIEVLQRHLFNDALWPDFTRIPSRQSPVLRFEPIHTGQVLTLGTRVVDILPARHTVPGIGFALRTHHNATAPAWIYTGDTGPNPALWQRLEHLNVAHLVIEVAFPDRDEAIAVASGHLHPAALERELRRLNPQAAVHLTHIKPGDLDTVLQEVGRLGLPHRLKALQVGDVFTL